MKLDQIDIRCGEAGFRVGLLCGNMGSVPVHWARDTCHPSAPTPEP